MPQPKKRNEPCELDGHNLTSVVLSESAKPMANGGHGPIIKQYVLLCSRCGRSFDEIKAQRPEKEIPSVTA